MFNTIADQFNYLKSKIVEAISESSIDVGKMTKGNVTTILDEITFSLVSEPINCTGFCSLLIEVLIVGTGTWKIDILGSIDAGASFVQTYDYQDINSTNNITVSGCYIFRGIPDTAKISATKIDGTATVTIKIQPING